MAENLLQKDYALAYKEASTALNRRVANEQKLLNDNKLSILAKRRLKKPSTKRPGNKNEIRSKRLPDFKINLFKQLLLSTGAQGK